MKRSTNQKQAFDGERVVSVQAVRKAIKLPQRDYFLSKGIDIPGFVWQQPPFRFDPTAFVPSSEYLHPKPFDESVQHQSLLSFENNPFNPIVYAVASEPNDGKALYFAAYLAYLFTQKSPLANVTWRKVFGGFSGRDYEVDSSNLLILTNLHAGATAPKLEYARDLLEAYSHIPRIVVIAGEDPVSFFATKLHYKMQAMYFHSSTLVKRKIEVT